MFFDVLAGALALLAVLTASVSAQRQFDPLDQRTFPTHQHQTTALDATVTHMPVDADATEDMDLGDLDGDGDLDLVITNTFGNKLYLNDGSGRFTDATTGRLNQAISNFEAALGDIDGDGDLDVMLAGYLPNHAPPLLLNDGTGIFVASTMRNFNASVP